MSEISPNTTLAHYRILSKLGAGGMGDVYLGQDTTLDRKVAIKVLPASSSASEEANKRFRREASTAAQLDHPNICSVYEAGQVDGRSYIVMQFVEGETLDVRLKRKPLDLYESLSIATQVADGLAEAHSRGIVHRDVKPSNIIITPREQAMVMDFGLAKFSREGVGTGNEAETQTFLTTPGAIIGTVPYMSPEQVHGQPIDARSDIFSFGVVLYEMLTGQQPFAAASGTATIAAILTKEPPSVTSYIAKCPEELHRITRKCLEKDRTLRYENAGEVRIDLERLKRDTETGQTVLTAKSESKIEEGAPPVQRFGSRSRSVLPDGIADVPPRRTGVTFTSPYILIPAALALLAICAAIYFHYSRATTGRPDEIKSLAILPLKSLDASENYLGLGIADAVIQRLSQTGELIVRPTSAVRRYVNEDTDALTAARQLNVDAILEGQVQRSNDNLRVSVNLLRVSDGASLWTKQFDMRTADIFTIEDTTSKQVASGLRLQLDPVQQARLTKRSTSNPLAYDYYLKGIYSFDQRISDPLQRTEAAIALLKKAIETDPDFALAHAKLAYAYGAIAVFVYPMEPSWAERAKEEINTAQRLDPQLAETHLARFQLLYSQYEGYQIEAAAREALSAEELDPNVGHDELGFLYIHLGLEDIAERELKRTLENDPSSEFPKTQILNLYEQGAKYDEWLAAHQKYFPNVHDWLGEAMYFMGKGRLEDAQNAINEIQKVPAENRTKIVEAGFPPKRALLFALQGDFRAAEAEIPNIVSQHPAKDPLYHHATYDIARIYALEGKTAEAVKWLRETAAYGFQPYPLWERDAYLNRIRQAPEFIQFMSEMKAQHEVYRREFGEGTK